MINFKCPSCNGEMSVSRAGDLVCSYCKGKFAFSDRDLRDYKEFRFRMLSYLSTISENPSPEETEKIWKNAEYDQFQLTDGRPLTISYLFKGKQEDVTIYTTRRNALFIFPKGKKDCCEHFSEMVKKLCYPSADIKGLSQFFPVVTGSFELADGRFLISVSKNEELYPLSAFGRLPAEHAAWIISRLENLCCALAYSDISHNGIHPESVFINARTHQAYLLGGWWNASEADGGSRQDLLDLRATAKRITGTEFEHAPKEFRQFISEPPAANAFEDFVLWDKVIEKGFHGRKFKKLDLSSLLL